MWPTGMELSADEKRLYVLSHYGALIDVVDTATNSVTSRIKFTTSLKPRTDGISYFAIDKMRDKLYAAWPELGIIGIANGASSTILGYIDLTQYGFNSFEAANGGPGLINLAVSETNDKLYVYFVNKGDKTLTIDKLLVFNGSTFAKESEIVPAIYKAKEYILQVNDVKNELYLDNKIFSLTTLQQIGTLAKGDQAVAFDSVNNALYTMSQTSSFKTTVAIHKLVNNVAVKEWTLDNFGELALPYFDFKNQKVYIADSFNATVKLINL